MSIYQKSESLTRIFEEMSLFFVYFQKRRDKPADRGRRLSLRAKLPQNGACKDTPKLPREPSHSPAPFCLSGSDSESESTRASSSSSSPPSSSLRRRAERWRAETARRDQRRRRAKRQRGRRGETARTAREDSAERRRAGTMRTARGDGADGARRWRAK